MLDPGDYCLSLYTMYLQNSMYLQPVLEHILQEPVSNTELDQMDPVLQVLVHMNILQL